MAGVSVSSTHPGRAPCRCAGWRFVTRVALLTAVSASIGLAATPAGTPTCPVLTREAYSLDPNPFGWPLTPNDWGWTNIPCWAKTRGGYAVCGGVRQSPINIVSTSAISGSDKGLVQSVTYLTGSSTQASVVKVSNYLRSVMIEGDFGTLTLRDNSGQPLVYEAFQVHLTAASLHSVDAKFADAEIMIFHRPQGQRDMLASGIIVSFLVNGTGGVDSDIFNQMGVSPAFQASGEASNAWIPPGDNDGLVRLTELQHVLHGNFFAYNGSVPVPPCTENIKWIVLQDQLAASTQQVQQLQDLLRTWTFRDDKTWKTNNKRPPVRADRPVYQNAIDLGGSFEDITCAVSTPEVQRAIAACWALFDPACETSHSPALISQTEAVQADKVAESKVPELSTWMHYSIPSRTKVTVTPQRYSLDVAPIVNGDWFGYLMLDGRVYLVRKISVRAIAQHPYVDAEGNQMQYPAQLIIEHSLFGDHPYTAAKPLDTKENLVLLSVPIKIGATNPLLKQVGLGLGAYKSIIQNGNSYQPPEDIDIAGGLSKSLSGNWYWYNGSRIEPGCADGAKWLLLERPVEASLDQLNYLQLEVPGPASTRIYKQGPTGTDHEIYMNHLPEYAVQADRECPDPDAPFDYLNVHCWDSCKVGCSSTCQEGMLQSPINVDTSSVTKVRLDNFLHNCRWRPVSGLKVVNTGLAFVVANQQMGYITQVGADGFPAYYHLVQFSLHMPSEHMLNGKLQHAELQIVHAKQLSVEELDYGNLIIASIFFNIGAEENKLLQQMILPSKASGEWTKEEEPQTSDYTIDLMRALGPTLEGNFYTYRGSLTTPPCLEPVKWFIFETAQEMSKEQFAMFKEAFPSPENSRPVQPTNGRVLAMNSFDYGDEHRKRLAEYDYWQSRNSGRNREDPGEGWIMVPIVGALVFGAVGFAVSLVREDGKRKREAAGGLADVIGKGAADATA